MAVQFMDSFSHYNTLEAMMAKWTTRIDNFGEYLIIPGGGRCLQNCLQIRQTQIGACSGPVYHPPIASLTEGVLGAGFRGTSVNSGGTAFFSIFNGDDLDVYRALTLGLNANGTLTIYTGSFSTPGPPVLRATSLQAIQDLSWHYVELQFKMSTSGGTANVYIDGDHSNPWISFSGNTGANNYTDFQLGLTGSSPLRISDFYYGNAMTDLKGDSRVYARLPNSDGSILQWTPKSGVTHYTQVDESTPDEGTTYNEDRTPGNEDLYGFPAIGIPSGIVHAVQVCPMMIKTDVGFRSVAPVVRIGGIDYIGATRAIGDGTYLYYLQVWDGNSPDGNPWTVNTASNSEFGVRTIV